VTITPALGKTKEKNPEFEASLGYIGNPVSKKQKTNKKIKTLPSTRVFCLLIPFVSPAKTLSIPETLGPMEMRQKKIFSIFSRVLVEQ
jgi:hypothetical protein